MAEIVGAATVSLSMTLRIGESEARALDAMAGYGVDAFVSAFYEKLGSAYMREHEGGLRLFLTSIREQMPPILTRTNRARNQFHGT